jgi:hypothetical protein
MGAVVGFSFPCLSLLHVGDGGDDFAYKASLNCNFGCTTPAQRRSMRNVPLDGSGSNL